MYIHRYCQICERIVPLSDGSFYTRYDQQTREHQGYFICSYCNKHSENRMPAALSRKELEKLFRNFQILKDRSAYNQSTLYNIYWCIYKNDHYVTTYGTDDENSFFHVIK